MKCLRAWEVSFISYSAARIIHIGDKPFHAAVGGIFLRRA